MYFSYFDPALDLYFEKINTTEKMVALTFDDGPSKEYTERILDLLKKHDIKATFFVLGRNVEKLPHIFKRTYEEGHEIGNHTWTHPKLKYLWPSEIISEIEKTDQIIRNFGYLDPIHFRSPYLKIPIHLPWVLKRIKKFNILCDIDPRDHKVPSVKDIVKTIMSELRPGSIILMHDANADKNNTVKSLDLFIPAVKKMGYKFVTVDQLLRFHKKDK